ncbi:hypothetical protein J3A83DRAFT_4374520 [Scleroderma citrinum]
MDELSKARAELTRLQEKEKELVKHLLDTRAEISVQQRIISSEIKLRPPAINTLSHEALLLIFRSVIYDHSGPASLGERKQRLASVSQHWKNLILSSPSLWNIIMVSEVDSVLIETSLKRSRETPLDIVIKISPNHTTLPSSLDILVSSLSNLVIEKINHLYFPSLKRVTIPVLKAAGYPNFLFSLYAPALEHLHLGKHVAWQDFSPAITLKSLNLTFRQSATGSPSFPYLIPTQTLTTLSLSGDISKWAFRPNTIPFLHLNTLTLCVNNTMRFLEAIVVPNLEHFVYSTFSKNDSRLDLFANLGSKFDSVHHLRFLDTSLDLGSHINPEYLRQAFRHVRHAELDSLSMLNLFVPHQPCGTFRGDVWSDLVSLTLHGPCTLWYRTLDLLSGWLEERKRLNIPPLHVKVKGIRELDNSNAVHQYFLRYYHVTKDMCTLELDARLPVSPKISISVGHDLSPELHLSDIPPEVMEDIVSAFLAGNVCYS